ncbi:MAG: AAA family ATPase [Nannocystis sp.]|nr:AAA family ATPase [Nannocystis sp.]MBA3547070.1 AAA family ATPase [Nannocystis sp.]
MKVAARRTKRPPPLPEVEAARTLVLFNNKGGVGKTTLTFNLAHMFARQGRRVALIDYDPQCNLTALALPESELVSLWDAPGPGGTVATCVERVRSGKGDLHEPTLHELADNLYLLPGDLRLSRFESKLAREWPQIFAQDAESAIHVTTTLDRLASRVAEVASAELVMFDAGPSLGPLNRSVLLAADAVVIPLAPDLFSLRGLQNVGEALTEWRDEWASARIKILQRAQRSRDAAPFLPEHPIEPIGYIVQQHIVYGEDPIRAYQKWLTKIPHSFAKDILRASTECDDVRLDEWCLGLLRHFASLVPLAQAAHKPLFDLKHADGVLGSQFQTVARATTAFEALAIAIGARLDAL